MAWKLEDDRPIYVQVVEIMRNRIIAGEFKPGDRLPSVRDLAIEAGANPNTIQRAFRVLEQMELVTTNRTNGKSVTTDEETISHVKQEAAMQEVVQFFTRMSRLGYDRDNALNLASKTS